MDDSVNTGCVGGTNEQYTKYREDQTDRVGGSKSEGIGEDKDESIPGGSAEVLTSDGALDICVDRNELNESFEAIKTAPGAAE